MFKFIQNPLSKVLLVNFVAIGTTGLFFITYTFNRTIALPILKYAAIMAIGIMSGFSARHFLNTNTGVLRFLAAATAIATSSILLEFMTQGKLGFDLLEHFHEGPNWNGLGQMGLGAIAAGITLKAWKRLPTTNEAIPAAQPVQKKRKRPKPKKKAASKQTRKTKSAPRQKKKPAKPVKVKSTTKKKSRVRKASARAAAKTQIRTPGILQAKFWKTQWEKINRVRVRKPKKKTKAALAVPKRRTANLKVRKRTRKQAPLQVKRTNGRAKRKAAGGLRSRWRRKKPVELVGTEEHCCPYCLEPVDKRDPRGMTSCPICHTWHHSDCWAVTGTCQVPHEQD